MPLAIAFGEAGVKPATRSFAGAKSKKRKTLSCRKAVTICFSKALELVRG